MTLQAVAAGRFKLDGLVNFATSAAIEEQGASLLLNAGDNCWEIDLSGISHADSSALSVFLSWIRLAEKNQKSIGFTGMPDELEALAQVCGIQPLLESVSCRQS
ncbi:lipid asymmetry maintenance protein MlaB [Endozoicomonas sp. SCSIO W0465]|uniref:STAS domain-containing protein n=1 Tax=Endozoicomonas sp. SCSIO W0465 TaxID=2918516 RepID=UPI00207666E4|nr:STAS domain-containing protein [Endozoicomonas sp. SCSIO W0465]USE38223.1 STAS domain-containing protein [Endozoicomonas sp. SCSIO W0465]